MTAPSSDLQGRLTKALAGQYVLDGLLGQGGMGTVFLARDTTLDRPVAIKVISPDVTGSAEMRERFLLEARTVARLRHPNIVSVYAAGESDGLLWFAMEYVPGESLRDRMAREPRMPNDDVIAIVHDLALALDAAHEADIVHRDVKPENILLDASSGRAMLTDFGVARALCAEDARITGAGYVLGSPRYMSPEQAAGESGIDSRSDLYSLGLVAYEMLAGRPVVMAETPAAVLAKHLTEEPTPLRELAANVPDALDTVIAWLLVKKPADRVPRGRAVAQVLEGADPDDPSLGSGGRTLKAARLSSGATRRRTRRLPLLIGGGLVAVSVAALAATQLSAPAEPATNNKDWLVAPFELQTADASLSWLREGAVNMLGLTLSQWNDLHIVDYERTLDLVRDVQGDDGRRVGLEDARRIARRANAGTVILGQINTTADSLLVIARRYDVESGAPIDEATAGTALTGDPRNAFERIARALLGLAGGPAINMELTQQTTESLEAYRLYLDGITALNRWELATADSLLARATQLDTAFALAYYKRAVGLGWQNQTDSVYLHAASRAVELSAKLPVRQQEIVAANRDLAQGFTTLAAGDAPSAIDSWGQAQQRLSALVAADSSDAEAWYGMADADFHAATSQRASTMAQADSFAQKLTRSLRGFERAIALDSSFHLAYSHLVSLYQMGATEEGGLLVDGDSIFLRAAITDTAQQARLVLQAQRKAKSFAAGWVQRDPTAAQAWQALTDTYLVLAQYDSAGITLRRAREVPAVWTAQMAYTLPVYSVLSSDAVEAGNDVRAAMARFDGPTMRNRGIASETLAPLASMSAAGMIGSIDVTDSLVEIIAATGRQLPMAAISTRLTADWFATGMKLAMGVPPTRQMRSIVAAGQEAMRGVPEPVGRQLRWQSSGVLYSAYLATGDSMLARRAADWGTFGQGGAFIELEAMIALARGDTASARTFAAEFPSPTALKTATLSYAGLRALTQAEVRRRLGDVRGAVETYEAVNPANFRISNAEPGTAAYARSFLQRGLLYEQLAQPEQAIRAYERFAELWNDADPSLQGEVRQARQAATRLRDSRRSQSIGAGGNGASNGT